LAAARVHGDDTPVALPAKGRTVQARLWAYVRDDRPFGGADPPAAFSGAGLGLNPVDKIEHFEKAASRACANAATGDGDGKMSIACSGTADEDAAALIGKEVAAGSR
jgi:hypothetical protein